MTFSTNFLNLVSLPIRIITGNLMTAGFDDKNS